MNPAQVEVEGEGVGHHYGRRVGLRPTSFRLESPGVVAIRGANGSGKSTLMRILAGLLRPSHGRTRLRIGERELEVKGRFRSVGYASPDLAFYPEFSVAENLAFAAETRGDPRPAAAVGAALEQVGLHTRAADRVAALSSGMLQRLRLAFALLHDPVLLLLDEPVNHLDEEGRATFQAWLGQARGGRLVVMATNDEREWRLADRAIELQGRGLGDPA